MRDQPHLAKLNYTPEIRRKTLKQCVQDPIWLDLRCSTCDTNQQGCSGDQTVDLLNSSHHLSDPSRAREKKKKQVSLFCFYDQGSGVSQLGRSL